MATVATGLTFAVTVDAVLHAVVVLYPDALICVILDWRIPVSDGRWMMHLGDATTNSTIKPPASTAFSVCIAFSPFSLLFAIQLPVPRPAYLIAVHPMNYVIRDWIVVDFR